MMIGCGISPQREGRALQVQVRMEKKAEMAQDQMGSTTLEKGAGVKGGGEWGAKVKVTR